MSKPQTSFYVIAALLVIGAVAGYYIFSVISSAEEAERLHLQESNITYEQRSFVTQSIPKYNITMSTQLPQILKNPIWRTPIRVYIDDAEAKRRRLAERPIQGLRKAMSTLENVTEGRLRFIEVDSADDADVIANFTFNFSSDEAVGEGGPTLYLRVGEFTLIKKGELHLLPVEYECTSYTLAVHEIGHVLGFGHSSHYNSVMWPRFGCLTNNLSEIVNDVAEIYQHYKPDLTISRARASVRGSVVNIEADILNEGPKDAGNAELLVYFNGNLAHTERIESVETGYSVNFRASLPSLAGVDEIKIEVQYAGDELAKSNNMLTLKPE